EPYELIELFQMSDCLIHASPMHEPYGVAVIEAMAAGMIVFASNVTCAALDRIENGINGFIHTAGDVQELTRQIIWMFRHPERMSSVQKAAQSTAGKWSVSRGVMVVKDLLDRCDFNRTHS